MDVYGDMNFKATNCAVCRRRLHPSEDRVINGTSCICYKCLDLIRQKGHDDGQDSEKRPDSN